MTKSNLKLWSSLLLFTFISLYLYSILFLFSSTEYTVYSIIIAYVAPVFVILYLLLLGPFSIKGFDKSFRIHLIVMMAIMGITTLSYFFLASIELLIGTTILKTCAVIVVLFMIILQEAILSDIDRIDNNRIKEFITFITDNEMIYFESKEVKNISVVIYLSKIAAIAVLNVSHISFYYIFCFLFVLLTYVLYIDMRKNFASNPEILKLVNRLSLIELLVYISILLLSFFKFYTIALLLIVLSNFKISFIKGRIQHDDFVKHNN